MASSKKPDEIEEIDQQEAIDAPHQDDQPEVATDEPTEDAPAEEVTDAPSEEAAGTEETADAPEDAPETAEAEETSEEVEAPVEETPAVTAPAPAEAKSSGGGFFPTLMGGVLAAGLGFGVSQFLYTGATEPAMSVDTSALEATLKDQASQIEVLRGVVDSLEAAPMAEAPDMTGLTGLEEALDATVSDVTNQIAALADQIGALDTRLADLEARPAVTGDGAEAAAVYEKELGAIRAELEAQQARNAQMTAELGAAAETAKAEITAASARARAVEAQAAVQAIQSALETGTSYAVSLEALPGDVPKALIGPAKAGVATLPELQASFDEFARAALSASLKGAPGETAQDRVGAFVRSQLNIRSLAPREGDDPDAILSRAQAALSKNALGAAVKEIDALPESGQAAMADWTTLAKTRMAAQKAIATVAEQLAQK